MLYRIKKILLWIPGFLSTAIAIVDFVFPTEINSIVSKIPDNAQFAIVFFMIIFGFLFVYLSFKNVYKQYKFKYNSKKFIRFFTKWYSKSGKISIVCDDLDWTHENNSDDIFQVLCKKAESNSLRLYLNKKDDDFVKTLKDLGAELYSRPENMSDYVFSFVEIMGNKTNTIIVRDKNNDPSGKVIFEERKDDKFLRLFLQNLVEQKESDLTRV